MIKIWQHKVHSTKFCKIAHILEIGNCENIEAILWERKVNILHFLFKIDRLSYGRVRPIYVEFVD